MSTLQVPTVGALHVKGFAAGVGRARVSHCLNPPTDLAEGLELPIFLVLAVNFVAWDATALQQLVRSCSRRCTPMSTSKLAEECKQRAETVLEKTQDC
jgi:hypothetical protein